MLPRNWNSACTQIEKLQVCILLKARLYTILETASSILKLCLHFIIISPCKVSTKTETVISTDNISMINLVLTNNKNFWNWFSSHWSLEKYYTCSIYCVVLTEYYFLNILFISLSHSCLLHNGSNILDPASIIYIVWYFFTHFGLAMTWYRKWPENFWLFTQSNKRLININDLMRSLISFLYTT